MSNNSAQTADKPEGMEPMVERVAIALCQNALGGKQCPCAETGKFNCADAYPGYQARAALTSANVEGLVGALREARDTLANASRQLTAAHKIALNGNVWGDSALAKIDAALAHTKEASNG